MALVVTSVMVLSACNGAGGGASYTEDEMKDKIVAAFEAMDEVDTVRSNVSMEGAFTAEGEEIGIDIDMAIGQEILDKEAMKFNADFDLSGSVTFQEYNVGFSLAAVLLQDAVYANLGTITGLEDQPNAAMILPMLEGYSNKWWSFELPEGGLAGLGLPEDADITAQQEELMALLKDADLFESIELVGSGKIGGVKADKFDIELSQDGVIEYMQKVTAMTEGSQELTEEEIQEFKNVMEDLELDTLVWVTESGYVGGIQITVVGQLEDAGDVVDVDLDIMIEYSDFNEDISIAAPEDATPFDLGGLGMGAPMMGDPAAGIVPEGTPLTLEEQMNPAY